MDRLTNNRGSRTVQNDLLKKESKKSRFKRLSKYKWGVGLEHEMQLFHYPALKKIKKGKKIDSYIMFNSNPYISELMNGDKLRPVDKEFVATIPFEPTGRKCNGKVVLEKTPVPMPEFVTDRPFSSLKNKRSIETYCDDMREREVRFVGLLNKSEKVQKLIEKYGNLRQFPYGVCDYFKYNRRESATASYEFKKAGTGAGDKLYTDYLGSYHLTLTLPFTEKTPLSKFIKMHQNFANQVQWIEPLLIAAFFSCDQKSVGSSEKRIKGSYRVLRIGWGNFAGTDIRKFSKGIGRYANIKPYWRENLDFYNVKLTNYCEKLSAELKKKETGAVSGFSSNFRTFGSTDPERPWHRESGIGMTKPNGVELRIFDHFSSEYTVELCRLIIYIAENSRVHKSTKYVYKNKYWIRTLQNIIVNGWHAEVEPKYVDILRTQLGLKIRTKSLVAYDVLHQVNRELYQKNRDGDWIYMMMDPDQTVPNLPAINRESWDMAFMIKMNREDKTLRAFNDFIGELPLNQGMAADEIAKIFFKHFNQANWKRDFINVLYFMEYIGVANLKHSANGRILTVECVKHQKITDFNNIMADYWNIPSTKLFKKYEEIIKEKLSKEN